MTMYILNGTEPVLETDPIKWGEWMSHNDERRILARNRVGFSVISTVFLGVDHGFWGDRPVLFETMVFEGPLDGETQRYSTWDEAMRGHASMVNKAMERELEPWRMNG